MRLSLWTQFSSNHSSYFALIGRFSDAAKAEQAANLLTAWMTTILYEGGNQRKLTPTEAALSTTYQIEWYKDGIDWNGVPDEIDDVVQRDQNTVFFMCPVETWDASDPFVELIKKLGAEHVDTFYGDYMVTIQMTCIAPDEATASQFQQHTMTELTKFIAGRSFLWAIPHSSHNTRASNGWVKHAGCNLEIKLEFFNAFSVCCLLKYLTSNGYTNIHYQFSSDD